MRDLVLILSVLFLWFSVHVVVILWEGRVRARAYPMIFDMKCRHFHVEGVSKHGVVNLRVDLEPGLNLPGVGDYVEVKQHRYKAVVLDGPFRESGRVWYFLKLVLVKL